MPMAVNVVGRKTGCPLTLHRQHGYAKIPVTKLTAWSSTTKSEPGTDTAAFKSHSHSISTVQLSRRSLLQQLALAGLLATNSNLAWGLQPVHSATIEATGLRLLSQAEEAAVQKALSSAINKSKAAVTLRLVFHDAGTYNVAQGDGGLNASIRLELDRPENFGLKRGWRIIEQVSNSLKGTPAAGLSYSDLIALAGAYAIELCKGPKIPVRVGRVDASSADPEGRLPPETLSAEQLKDNFAQKGFNSREFLVLTGSHTLGGKGFGDPVTFDNTYYKELLKKPWLNPNDSMASMIGLPSDHVLPEDQELLPMIQEYADDEALFFKDFTAAYIKMTELGAA